MNMQPVFSTAYFPPISYMCRVLNCETLVIEKHEYFVKQTYRNRCSIFGANGKLHLIIPLQREAEKTPVFLKKICYKDNWRKLHWRSIESAYRSSPYFEFFESDFRSFYFGGEIESLLEFNTALLELVLKVLKETRTVQFTEEYKKEIPAVIDYRNFFHPGAKAVADPCFQPVKYHQVFSGKMEFLPNLSVIDLLFNEGLHAKEIMKQSLIC